MEDDVPIRPYRDGDERGWVVCRALSFLDSAFFDDVRRTKEHYEHPAITADHLRPVKVFAHYVGDDREKMRNRFARVHDDVLYELPLRMMEPDLELTAEAVGSAPITWEPLRSGGYTRSRAWRVSTAHGLVFAKEADDEGSLHMLRREAVVHRDVSGPFLPSFVGFADSGERAVLAVELIGNALWPPPYPDNVAPLFDALALVAAAEPPPDLPAHARWWSRWERVAADPGPLLGLRLCSREWLESSLDRLIAAEEGAVFEGDELVHNDVYSGNVCFTTRGAVLVDWGAALRGSHWIDVAFALHSTRVEGGLVPRVDFPDEAAFAAALAGHFAVDAPAPLPEWAEPGSTLREDMARDLAHALQWVAELLELPLQR